ncbi:molybdopterin cofactor-binding domain-containing protein [Hyphomicrobium sp.]|uniref:xanthine dehydrogenase family protein molybdopterin-binding subunit n=1 Tax=Hyphomicrobium sp. TaxID=82 RepID=UPI002C50C695|nr:molybdopterin cofactor-binding domain-containing protein [Hyphomicrobium sp.]HRN89311.1 molybdopterin-dependent oxidoreductase [Hyphomicrobium sp.]HRQ26350.1 molybdopterin-dependent oxidoreductase [Hyphomicrobium sp.]
MLHYLKQEAEKAERKAAPVLIENVSRRSFVGGALAASGLVLAVRIPSASAREKLTPYPTGGADMPHGYGSASDPHVFVSIKPDGSVTILAHRAEMGTGVRTSLPMVVVDEMEADWSQVSITQAVGDEPLYGNQDTDGSRSMRHYIQPMRECGAAMRQMLEQAAATKWGIDVSRVRAKAHRVVQLDDAGNETGETLGFGDLAEAAMALPVPARETLLFKTPDEFNYMRKGETKITDLHDITTGKAIYGADIRLSGMKYAVMIRPAVLGEKLKSFDGSAALKVPGVEAVHEIEGFHEAPRKFAPLGGVAVVANSTYAAMQGREALAVEWEPSADHAGYNTDAFFEEMSETSKKPGKVIRNQGDVDAAFANAKSVFSEEYRCQHLNQASMEPLVAVARVADGKCEVWAPVQSPYGAREDLAKALELPIENVTVHVTLLGGGFGRKSKWDFMVEAALISRKIGGAPVLLQWTREDDMHHSFYHTVSVERIEMAFDDAGKVTGFRHRTVAPSIVSTFAPDSGYQFNIEYGMGFVNTPYEIPNVRCENGQAFAHTRIGWLRSVSNIPRAFAVQSAVAEAAHALGRDHREFLLELIGSDRILDLKALGYPEDFWHYGDPYESFPVDTARLKHVINVATEKAGWGKELPKGQGLGLAAHLSWHNYVATVVRVEVKEDGTITVPHAVTAMDCGFYVNPERIRSQVEGAAVMGMSHALYSGITFKNGAVEQSNFYDFEIARMSNFPQVVDVHLVEPQPGRNAAGVGEPGLPPFAPALANAVFAATGKRLRTMPMGEKVA